MPLKYFDENKQLTKEFKCLIKEIFMKWDLNKDGYLDREELRHYFSTLNGERLNDFSLNWAMLKNSGNTDGFDLEQFYHYYVVQTSEDVEETLNDLIKQYSYEELSERLK